MGLLLIWGAGNLNVWIEARAWERIGRLAFWVIAGIMVYGVTIFALGLRPAQLVVRREAGISNDHE
jgi:putative peptidoglycan lipid II flippase